MTLPRLNFHWPQGAFALRLVAAALIALWMGHLLPGDHAFSAVISALLVVRPYQQGALRAGALRLLATIGGIALAFAATYLNRLGLNDYIRLLVTLLPLGLLAAYDTSYRSALIAAVLMIAAPGSHLDPVAVALNRGAVVALGAAIGIAVSVLVLPRPHKQVTAEKALAILGMLAQQFGDAPLKQVEKRDTRLRRALLDLSQTVRDNLRHSQDDDVAGRIVRLTRHAQAACLLLRSQWKQGEGEGEAFIAALTAIVTALQAKMRTRSTDPIDLKPLYAVLPEDQPAAWLARAIANDIAAISKLL
ncbi:MAG: FUSC family protein [Asticcacaulis sp.]|nr:FUSC family protein [Asticcacaulis sp.]